MKMANIRFDDPVNLADPSQIFLTVMKDLELLDYARDTKLELDLETISLD